MSDSLNRSEGKNMKIERFVLGPIETNCYVVVNEDTKECFAVDMAYCPQEYVDHIREQGYQMKALFLTHGHFDHIMAADEVRDKYNVKVYASSMYGYHCAYTGAKALEDGQTVECAGTEIHVIHTPGHTVGGCCYYLPEEEALFCGDTLFCGSIGRTDLPTGSSRDLAHSIREKLMILPDETKLYPGHMDESTIGYEKEINPFI